MASLLTLLKALLDKDILAFAISLGYSLGDL